MYQARRAQVLEKRVRQVYLPAARTGDYSAGYVIIRVRPDLAARVELVAREEAARLFPGGDISVIRMAEILAPQYRPWELGAKLFTVFGLLALLVAAVGVFSTLSHEVSQRRHELGVRAALGATLAAIVRLVASLLHGVAPSAPWSLAFVLVTLFWSPR